MPARLTAVKKFSEADNYEAAKRALKACSASALNAAMSGEGPVIRSATGCKTSRPNEGRRFTGSRRF